MPPLRSWELPKLRLLKRERATPLHGSTFRVRGPARNVNRTADEASDQTPTCWLSTAAFITTPTTALVAASPARLRFALANLTTTATMTSKAPTEGCRKRPQLRIAYS